MLTRYTLLASVTLLVTACGTEPPTATSEKSESIQVAQAEPPVPPLHGHYRVAESPADTQPPGVQRQASSGSLLREQLCLEAVSNNGVFLNLGWGYPNIEAVFLFQAEPAGIVGLSLSRNGPFTSTLEVTVTTDENGYGRTLFYVKALAPGSATLMGPCALDPYGHLCVVYHDPDGSGTHEGLEFLVFSVDGIDIDVPSSPATIEATSTGLAVYPGKLTPADAEDRRQVVIRATTSVPEARVYFRSFDLDDEGADPVVEQNIGGIGSFSSSAVDSDGGGVATTAFSTTMHPGDDFRVAGACDLGYLSRISVVGDKLYDEDRAQIPDNDNGGPQAVSSSAAGVPRARATKKVRVWRDLHIEVDTMDVVVDNRAVGWVYRVRNAKNKPQATITLLVTSNDPTLQRNQYANGTLFVFDGIQVTHTFHVLRNRRNTVVVETPSPLRESDLKDKYFELIDNDDYNRNGDGNADELERIVAFNQLFDLVQDYTTDQGNNLFAAAYIRLRYDGGGRSANNQRVPFVLNVPHDRTGQQAADIIAASRQARGTDDYWVAYMQIAYQGDASTDNDPNAEKAALGYTPYIGLADQLGRDGSVPAGGVGSFLFQETIRDYIYRENASYFCLPQTAPHELGHQLGLEGDAPGMRVMDDDVCDISGFTNSHLKVLRSRVKSPGQ